MSKLTTFARPYAKAAFEHAQANHKLASWSDMLRLAASVSQYGFMKNVLESSRLRGKDKSATFIEACGDKFDVKLQNFISVISENDRLPLLPEIAGLFNLYKADKENSIEVEVTSAFALNQEQQEELAKVISVRLDREVSLLVVQDPLLIGGLVIRAGDLVIDGSIRGKLAILSEALKS